VDWIHVAQDKDWWQAVVNTVVYLWFHKGGDFHDELSDYHFLKDCDPCSPKNKNKISRKELQINNT
jgi:hypothetical protein